MPVGNARVLLHASNGSRVTLAWYLRVDQPADTIEDRLAHVEVRQHLRAIELARLDVVLDGLDQDPEVLSDLRVRFGGLPFLQLDQQFPRRIDTALVDALGEIEDLFVQAIDAEASGVLGIELRQLFENDLGVFIAPGDPVRIIGHRGRGKRGQKAAENQLSHVSPSKDLTSYRH